MCVGPVNYDAMGKQQLNAEKQTDLKTEQKKTNRMSKEQNSVTVVRL